MNNNLPNQPFSGVRVLDLTWFIAGPYCTKMFGDYGAEVIKIEPPIDGDPARKMEPFLNDEPHPDKSLLFSHLNLNKKGITLNLKDSSGKSIFLELVKNADVVVESFSPGVMKRFGLGYSKLKQINPKLVVTSISNFGQTGPYRNYKLSELVLNGFHSMINNGVPDRYPLKKGGYVCLYQSGLIAALATMAAVWHSEEQGQGQHVDISIMETQVGDVDRKTVDLLAWNYSGRTIYGMRPDAEQWANNSIMPLGTYPCKEGFVTSSPILPHWERFVELMNKPELEQIKYPQDMFDMKLKGEIDAIWYLWLSKRTSREAMKECQAVKWFSTAVATPKDVVEDPHLKEHGFWEKVKHPISGEQLYPGAPVNVGEGSWRATRPAPTLGQHNTEIYGHRMGMGQLDLDILRKRQVI